MIAIVALHHVADLALLQGQGGLLKLGDHGPLAGGIAVGVGGQTGVLAVLVHQFIEQGDGVVRGPQLLEQLVGLGLLLGDGLVVQGGIAGGAVVVGHGLGHVLGQQQDVLGPIIAQLVLGIGLHLGVGGIALGALAEILVLKQLAGLAGLIHLLIQGGGQHLHPEIVVLQRLAAQLLGDAGLVVLQAVDGLLRHAQALFRRQLGQQAIEAGQLHGRLQQGLGGGGAVVAGLVPAHVGDAIGAVLLLGIADVIVQPIQQTVRRHLILAHRAHHGVPGDTGGGQIGGGDVRQVHGLHVRGAVAGAALAAGAVRPLGAAGEKGRAQGQGQGGG